MRRIFALTLSALTLLCALGGALLVHHGTVQDQDPAHAGRDAG